MEIETCPRCGATNDADALNCAACRINLEFARENPAQIERIRREAAGGAQFGAHLDSGRAQAADRDEPALLPVLLLLASFVFAFCLGEAIHELGHFFAHRAYGVDVGIRLDPFGGSHIIGGSLAPRELWGITSAAGPLFNVAIAVSVFVVLWRWRRPALLPLLLWGPIALVQEGVTFSLGLLTPGGDAALITESGVPAGLVLGCGILFLVMGIAGVCLLLPQAGLSPSASFSFRLRVVAGGMVSFMAVRLLFSPVTSPGQAGENVLPLAFSLLLAAAVAALYGPVHRLLGYLSRREPATVPRFAVALSGLLALGMVAFQLAWFN
ncbi:MAG: hypothetical protein ACK2U9_13345 [Anaerolineae bacterium]